VISPPAIADGYIFLNFIVILVDDTLDEVTSKAVLTQVFMSRVSKANTSVLSGSSSQTGMCITMVPSPTGLRLPLGSNLKLSTLSLYHP